MKRIGLIRILAVFFVLAGIVYFNLNIFSPGLIPSFLRIGVIRKPINILIMGTDITYNAETKMPMPELEGRADSILLVHIDPIKNKIKALSIPRDTYLQIPGYGMKKINAANAYGGVNLVKETIYNFLKQDIDYYVEIKPTAITKVVNFVGGISLFVEKDMRYIDRAQNMDINLKKGWQKLSGSQAQDYIRFRFDIQGDIGRIDRQQKFVKAFSKALTRPSNILKSPFIISSVLEEIETDLPLALSIRLLNLSRMISSNNIMTTTVSGEPSYINNVGSVWNPNLAALEETMQEYF